MSRIFQTCTVFTLVFASTAIAQDKPRQLTPIVSELSDSAKGRLNPNSGFQSVNQVGMKRCENAGVPRPPDFDCHHSLWQEISNTPSQYGPPRTASTARRFIHLGENPAGFCILTAEFASNWTGSGGAYGPVSILCTGANGNSCSWTRDVGSWGNTALHPRYQFNITTSSTGNGGFCAEPSSPSAYPVEIRRQRFSVATVTPP